MLIVLNTAGRHGLLQRDHTICGGLLARPCLCLPFCPYRRPVCTITVEEEHFSKEGAVRKDDPVERQNGKKYPVTSLA